ncbi:MAG TPA: hypothetical protein IAB56_00985 [Candidatus Scybalousia intestinigallinarum]|nr:hypothetical protein [Candidatus Scybalousia intestinigallinarum]
MKIILTVVYIILTTLGIFLMKLGGNSLSLSFTNGVNFKIGFVTLLGFLSYLGSFLLWQKLIVTFDLSYIVPITTGICQLLILIIGICFFKEQVNIVSIVGAILIIIGVVLLALGKR